MGRPLLPSVRTVAAPRRKKKATARSTRPKTSLPMATPECEGDLREKVGSCSWPASAWSFSERRFLLRTRPHVAELFAARDPLLGHESFEYQLTRRHYRGWIFLARQPHLIDQREEAGDDGEALEQRLGALVGCDLERAALIEPVDDVVHVGATDAALERAAGRAANQVLGDRFRPLQLALVLQLELAGDRGQGGVHVRNARYDGLLFRDDRTPFGVR